MTANSTIPDDDPTLLYFNGLRADGEYIIPPMTPAEFAASIAKAGEGKPDPNQLKALEESASFALSRKVQSPGDLSQTGWGVIFPAAADPKQVAASKEALSELLNHRRTQAGARDERYFRIFEGANGYRPGDTKRVFLERLGLGSADVVDPSQGVPYYLLLVGSPAEIPYRFQFELDVQFAVGRICFETPQEYANYARNVVAVETGQVKRRARAAFFGVANDPATHLSASSLIEPLYTELSSGLTPTWDINNYSGPQATRAQLEKLLGGQDTPAFLFTASHGMGFHNGDSRQYPHQGAIVCQDWRYGPVTEAHYFAGDHLTNEANLLGLITFSFACFGAGTPQDNEYLKMDRQLRQKYPSRFPEPQALMAPQPFIAGLPIRMLGKSNGALAFVGHVERAWGYSFGDNRKNTETFSSVLYGLLQGDPLGFVADDMSLRYATLATEMTGEMQEIELRQEKFPAQLPDYLKEKEGQIISLWTEQNDARNYIVLGDPAVRLNVTASEAEVREQPVAEIRLAAPGETPPAFTPAPQPALPAVTPAVADTSVAYFLWGNSNKPAGEQGPGPLREFVEKLGDFLVKALEDVTTLEVDTYVSRDMGQVEYANGRFTGSARLRASTRITVDGDTRLCVPENEDGKVDTELWAIHLEAVKQAQISRAELLKTAISAGTGLLNLVKPG